MPGLSQLKQFSTDILNLGDELKIRAARGEKPSTLPIPADIEDKDDSDDFVLGMPQLSENELEQADAAAAEEAKAANDFSDITGENKEEGAATQQTTPTASKLPDVSDLLAPASDTDFGDLDLSEFEEPAAPKEPPKPKEVPIEDLDLDSLLAPSKKTQPAAQPAAPKPQPVSTAKKVSPTPAAVEAAKKETESFEAEFPPELQAVFNKTAKPAPAAKQPAAAPASPAAKPTAKPTAQPVQKPIQPQKQAPQDTTSFDDLETLEPLESLEPLQPEQAPAPEKPAADDSFDLAESNTASPNSAEDEFAFDGNAINLNEGLPEELDESPSSEPEPESEPEPAPQSTADESFDIPEPSFEEAPAEETPVTEAPVSEEPPAEQNAESDIFDTSALDNLPDFGTTPSAEEPLSPEMEVPETPEEQQSQTPPAEAQDSPIETFDTSAIDQMDFSSDTGTPAASEEPSNAGATDFELGSFNSGNDSDFNIPGFSDTTTANLNKAKPVLSTPDFSDAKSGDAKPKNTFTDTEYKRFEKNLSEYPLNVRIALEDLVVKNEFTDDAVFAILEKVLRKVPARQIASDLEKMLDITLDVPRDYERRTAEEYDAYKKSVEYQLKNRILPGAILTTAAAALIFCISTIIFFLILQPSRATHLYKQGYALIAHDEYAQSEDKFNQALVYKPIKKWFFKYAERYREHKQYERAATMYRATLQRFDHDKKAGLDWATMELTERFNYEETERILKREVLDYHINDADAILLLGDDYLEWATEKDETKFDAARDEYALLLQLYGDKHQNLYLGRMMRYYIRTDDLRQVLTYKEHFYPLKKGLDPHDLTELSGYLLDKRYGKLKPSEEALRTNIEDVRDLLERAVKADSSNPIALYNMGRYFVETANDTAAKSVLQSALDTFKTQRTRNKRDTYKYINTFRLMGEQYRNTRDYIPAEETYTNGIELFKEENASSGFESDENIGKLYADLADIDYFISGDSEAALLNYQNSINNKNDTPSIRYRVGYIQYTNKKYSEALGSFIRSSESKSEDTHLLLALANTLSLRNDNYAAEGYYEKLLSILDKQRELHGVLLPQVREDQADLVDTYMKGANNLGVTLNRIALVTGDSKKNGEAIVRLSESLRAYDALTRNQKTMVRLKGSNLAEQNIKYIDHASSQFTPEIYTEIPYILSDEKGLE